MPARTLLSRTLVSALVAVAIGVPIVQARDLVAEPFAGPPASVPVGPPATTPVGPPATKPVGPPATTPVGPPATTPVGPPTGVPPGPPATVPVGPPARGVVPVPVPVPPPVSGTKATVNFVHGIPDTSVTVCVDGSVALPTFDYEDIATVQLDAATYAVEIVTAPPIAPALNAPCPATLTVLGPYTEAFAAGKNYSVVVHLEPGSGNIATVFENDVSPARPGTARVVLHHVADAGAVVAKIGRPTPSALDVTTAAIENGDAPLVVHPRMRPGNWVVNLFDSDPAKPALLFGPEPIQFHPRTTYLLYVVGDPVHQYSLLVLRVGLSNF